MAAGPSSAGRIRFLGLALALVVGLGPADTVHAVAPDPGFGQDGKVVVGPPDGTGETATAAALQPDGKILVGGIASPLAGYAFMLLRFEADGRPDPTFGQDGRVWTDLATALTPAEGAVPADLVATGNAGAYALALQPDGYIVLGGYAVSGVTAAFALVRYTPDGHLDRSFGSGGVVVTDFGPDTDDVISGLAVLPDGRILAAGGAGEGGAQFSLARYLPDGRPDPSFGDDGVVVTRQRLVAALALTLDGEGRALAAGQAGLAGGPFDFGLARYLLDGRLDPTFGDRGVVRSDLGPSGERITDIVVGPGGAVTVAGASGASMVLARYLPDGRLDPAFGSGGVVRAGPDIGWGRKVVALLDGRFLVAGGQLPLGGESREVVLCRYGADGTFDVTFGSEGIVATDIVPGRHDDTEAAILRPDGSLVVAGSSLNPENLDPVVFLVRYHDVRS